MRGNIKTIATAALLAALFAGCSMNDQGVIDPMPVVREDWNDNINCTPELADTLFNVNQFFVKDGIVFHDYVQRDMGLKSGEVWYPTYEMANANAAPAE